MEHNEERHPDNNDAHVEDESSRTDKEMDPYDQGDSCRYMDTEEKEKPNISLALLPPDHPYLKRFQEKLKEYLLHSKNQLINEIDEIKYALKHKEVQHQELGASLYDMQTEIQQQNEQLEDYAQQIEDHLDERHREEETVSLLKCDYEEKAELTKEQKTIYNKRMMELEHMQELENNIRNWANEMDDEVKNAKSVVSRDTQLQQQLSEEKRKSDLLLYHLDVEVKKSEKELAMVQNEMKDMQGVLDLLSMSVSNANADLEDLENEHKRLSQTWSEVIVAISLRDRILHQVQVDIDKEKESIKLNTSGITALKKQIKKEMQLNEKLETFKQRIAEDFSVLKKECKQLSNVLSELERKLTEIPILLEQTEKDLKEADREGVQLETENKRIQLKLDKEYNKKYETEENILKIAQDQLITDKASEYRLKLLHIAQEQRRGMELTLAQAQNQLSTILLDMERSKGNHLKSRQENDELNKKLSEQDDNYNHVIDELKNLELQIEIRMKRMDKLNIQYDELTRSNEGNELSPTEIKIKQMEKSIHAAEQQIREYQQFWIILQNHYVQLTQKRNSQMNQIQITQKQLSIIRQKSLKVDTELEQSENTTSDLCRDIQAFQAKLEQLNVQVFKRRQKHENDEGECEREHSEILEKLKENEMKILYLEDDINELHNEIEQHKDYVLDHHRESLSWETKYKLIEETMKWRKEEGSLDSELGTMRTEIHRMQIRHQQLKRAQEKLFLDLDHCVMHRQSIDNKSSKIKQTNSTVQYKINDLRAKLRQIQNEITVLSDQRIAEHNAEYERLQEDVKQLRSQIEHETDQDALIRAEIEQGLLLKHQNLDNIVRKQNRAKQYRRLNMSAQPLKLPRSETVIDSQMQKQIEMNDNIIDIIQTLSVEHSEKQSLFTKLLQVLKN